MRAYDDWPDLGTQWLPDEDVDALAEDAETPDDLDDYTPEEPTEEDLYICPCGPLGGRTRLAVYGGKMIGEYLENQDALDAAREWMDRNRFWPNIWRLSDHGNWTLLRMERH